MKKLIILFLLIVPIISHSQEISFEMINNKLGVMIESDKNINAIEGNIIISPELVLKGIDDSRSIVSFWIKKETEGDNIFLSGIIPGGYDGSKQTLISLDLEGSGYLKTENFKFFLNDGEGTSINIEDKIKDFNLDSGDRRIEDNIPPEKFTVFISQDKNLDNKRFISFNTKDKESGISHYEILEKLVSDDWIRVDSPYILRDQLLKNDISVRAYDGAGNYQEIILNKKKKDNYWYLYIGGALILILFSIFLKKKAFLLLFLVLPGVIEASSLNLSSKDNIKMGEHLVADIFVDSEEENINAISGTIIYSDKLSVESISKENSIVDVWVTEPTIEKDRIVFEGIILNPGFTGDYGHIMGINLLTIGEGNAYIKFESGSTLLNDGKGTNSLINLDEHKYNIDSSVICLNIKHPNIVSSHNKSSIWYSNNNPTFSWDQSGVTKTKYSLSKSTKIESTKDNNIDSALFSNVDDGIWYFNLQTGNNCYWSSVASHLLMIDTEPPIPFEISPSFDGNYKDITLNFQTTDKLSGVDYYEITSKKIGTIKTEEPYYKFRIDEPKECFVAVRAYDKAGNYREEGLIISLISPKLPKISYYSSNLFHKDHLILSGESEYGNKIRVRWNNENQSNTNDIWVEKTGKWFFVSKKPLHQGYYIADISSINNLGVESKESHSIKFRVLPPFYVRIGDTWINYQLFVSISGLIILIIIFSFYKYFSLKRIIKKSK